MGTCGITCGFLGGENEKTKGLGGNVFPDTAAVVRFRERWDLSLSH